MNFWDEEEISIQHTDDTLYNNTNNPDDDDEFKFIKWYYLSHRQHSGKPSGIKEGLKYSTSIDCINVFHIRELSFQKYVAIISRS